MRQVTQDICMRYGFNETADFMRWDMLVMELERNPHTLETLKETQEFLSISRDYIVRDELLEKLIKIHLDFHPF